MEIQEISRDLDRIHMQEVNLARYVNDGNMTLEEARSNIEQITATMSAESRAAAEGLLARLTAKR